MFNDPLLVGAPIAALTALVVEAMKRAGLAARLAPWAAVAVAASLMGMAELALRFGWAEALARVVVVGIMIGLASSGGYSWVRHLREEG